MTSETTPRAADTHPPLEQKVSQNLAASRVDRDAIGIFPDVGLWALEIFTAA